MEDLNDHLSKLKDALKSSKNKENSLLDDINDLNQELQKKVRAHTKVLREKEEMEKENEELTKRIKRLTNSIQVNNTCWNTFPGGCLLFSLQEIMQEWTTALLHACTNLYVKKYLYLFQYVRINASLLEPLDGLLKERLYFSWILIK